MQATLGIHRVSSITRSARSFPGSEPFHVLEFIVEAAEGEQVTISLFSADPLVIKDEEPIAAAPPGELVSALRDAADYLDCIPESAAGGDDEAIRLVRRAREAIARTTT